MPHTNQLTIFLASQNSEVDIFPLRTVSSKWFRSGIKYPNVEDDSPGLEFRKYAEV